MLKLFIIQAICKKLNSSLIQFEPKCIYHSDFRVENMCLTISMKCKFPRRNRTMIIMHIYAYLRKCKLLHIFAHLYAFVCCAFLPGKFPILKLLRTIKANVYNNNL